MIDTIFYDKKTQKPGDLLLITELNLLATSGSD